MMDRCTHYRDRTALSWALRAQLTERLRALGIESSDGSLSEQSCSVYLEIEDAEGCLRTVRISDHEDRHGSDVSLLLPLFEEAEERGEYLGLDVEEWRVEEWLVAAARTVQAMLRRPA